MENSHVRPEVAEQMCNIQAAVLTSSKCRPLFHELFLIAVHSHGHGASDPRTSLCCRERAAIMPHPSHASLVSEKRWRNSSFAYNFPTPSSARAFARPPASWLRSPTFFFFFNWSESVDHLSFSPVRQWVKGDNKIQEESSCGDVLFQGSFFISLTWRFWRCSFWGCKRWEATLTDPNWCDSTGAVSLPRNNEPLGAWTCRQR